MASSEDEVVGSRRSTAIESSDEDTRLKTKNHNLNADSSDEEDLRAIDENGLNSNDESSVSKMKRIAASSDEDSLGNTSKLNAESSEDEYPVSKVGEVTAAFKNRIVDSSDEEGPVVQRKNTKSRDNSEDKISDSSDEDCSKEPNSVNADSSDEEPRMSSNNEDVHSSDNENDLEPDGLSMSNSTQKTHKSKERKSKSSALNEIRSESQRLQRESTVGLPYHRPRQRTLDDFLNRMKGTPDVVPSIKLNQLNQENDKTILERQKLVVDFYKMEEEIPKVTQEPDTGNGTEETCKAAENRELTMNENDLLAAEPEGTDSEPKESKASHIDSANEAIEHHDSTTLKGDSLNLILEETPTMEMKSHLPANEASNRKLKKLEALRNQVDNEFLLKSLQCTPKLGSGNLEKDELFSPVNKISDGAQKLFKRFVVHAQTPDRLVTSVQNTKEALKIVKKVKDACGNETLDLETIDVQNKEEDEKPTKKMSYLDHKRQLKKKMFEKKLSELKKKEELIKLNNEEMEEEIHDVNEDHPSEDDEFYGNEDSEQETESEPEEDDVDLKDVKKKRGLFVDDEAEESGEEADEEESEDESNEMDDDDDSLNLVEDDGSRKQRKKGFKKIKDADFLSDDSNPVQIDMEDIERNLDETPINETNSVLSVAGSTHSSASSLIFNSAPRWTPFKDRIDSNGIEIALTGEADTSAASQLAKKRLGFEGLFDGTDPEVEDMDDIVNLCSGKFASPPKNEPSAQIPIGGNEFSSMNDSTNTPAIESQDTIILTGNDPRRTQEESIECTNNTNSEMKMKNDQTAENCESDEESDAPIKESNAGAGRIIDSSDDEIESSKLKKRKRKVISDEESEESGEEMQKSQDKPEMQLPVKDRLFDKKGRLRRDFFENEAELSGSEEEVSEDEDEKGLDRLELEEGDYDEIDEHEERDKVGRIHQRVLLDQDQAEIRLFQERFLEDGDLHTDNKRQRQFKWKGLDDDLEIGKRDSDDEENEKGENEESWRIQRLEREKWIKDNNETQRLPEVESDSQFFQQAKRAMVKKTTPGSAGRDKLGGRSSVPNGALQPLDILNRDQRSSFLTRSETTLEMMALYTRKTDDRSGAGAKKSAGNFVFAAVTPEKPTAESVDETKPVKPNNKPVSKKVKLDRTLQTDNRSTIFNLL